MATAAGVRPRIFEFGLSSSASPADQSSRYLIAYSSTGAPTGGTAPTIGTLDPGDPAALATSRAGATGGETMGNTLYMISVNLRASFRWVAAPTKEFVVANTQYAGCGIQVAAQSAAYNVDTCLVWEE